MMQSVNLSKSSLREYVNLKVNVSVMRVNLKRVNLSSLRPVIVGDSRGGHRDRDLNRKNKDFGKRLRPSKTVT